MAGLLNAEAPAQTGKTQSQAFRNKRTSSWRERGIRKTKAPGLQSPP